MTTAILTMYVFSWPLYNMTVKVNAESWAKAYTTAAEFCVSQISLKHPSMDVVTVVDICANPKEIKQ